MERKWNQQQDAKRNYRSSGFLGKQDNVVIFIRKHATGAHCFQSFEISPYKSEDRSMLRSVGFVCFLLGAPLPSASNAAHLTMMVTTSSTASTNTSATTDATGSLATDATIAASETTDSSSTSDTVGSVTPKAGSNKTGGWHMSPVTVVQARVQGDAPVWNTEAKMWLSKYGDTTELAYMNNLDTVNTASVEGALMYVQAEGINVNEQSVKCQRKNKMQYIVFYQLTIVQPTYGIKYYEKHTPPEYGEFVAMDGAKCTDQGSDLSEDCKVYYGLDGQMDIGPMVGANLQTTDPRAPYLHNHWFSYPNSCAQKLREDKTDECRAEYPGGLCPLGVEPNGDNCTFSYTILGFLNLDDLVGITAMGYRNYTAFCEDGGIEFKAKNTGSGFDVEESIAFWKNPGDEDANSNRTSVMVKLYNTLAANGTSNMTPLPSPEKLTAANPKCYENSQVCASAQYGCNRTLYSQICTVCASSAAGCEAAPASFSFPKLTLPANSTSDGKKSPSNDAPGPSSTASIASMLLSLAVLVASSLL
ncbi:hypothetical protein PsorP6_001486 [Peronosclerospora sorghi]|uniref:Uncharacterized protein n=1 Tax=Peronosclerospora sorghi TaxID=230839 RepID=A0ACC0WUX9_9STRA|nr:hypothetical protein PsorP6_001486 [Peronosclerospora sorghi]